MDINAESNCFIAIKNHKESFLNHPKVSLINPEKDEISKKNQDNP